MCLSFKLQKNYYNADIQLSTNQSLKGFGKDNKFMDIYTAKKATKREKFGNCLTKSTRKIQTRLLLVNPKACCSGIRYRVSLQQTTMQLQLRNAKNSELSNKIKTENPDASCFG